MENMFDKVGLGVEHLVFLFPSIWLARDPKLFRNLIIIVRAQNMAIEPNLYSGSQSICIVGFEFPIMGGPTLGGLSTLLFLPTLLFTLQSHYLSFLE